MWTRRLAVVAAVSGLALAACSSEENSAPDARLSPEMHEAYLEQIAAMYAVEDAPSVDIVRVVKPEEQLELVAECMQEAGWPETTLKDGGLQYQDLPDQEEAMNAAFYTCFAQFPLEQEFLAAGPEYYEELYAYYVDEVKPCLEGQGITISEPPSFDSWLAVAEQDTGEHWNPTLEIPPDVDLAAIQEICPQNPER